MPSQWYERALAERLPDTSSASGGGALSPPAAAAPAYPAEWLAGVERASRASPPPRLPPEAWRAWCDDARAFLDAWGERTHGLGWSGEDLFGVHPSRPRERLDAMGLVPLLDGRRVVAMTGEAAGIVTPSGGALTFRLAGGRVVPKRALFWNLAALTEKNKC